MNVLLLTAILVLLGLLGGLYTLQQRLRRQFEADLVSLKARHKKKKGKNQSLRQMIEPTRIKQQAIKASNDKLAKLAEQQSSKPRKRREEPTNYSLFEDKTTLFHVKKSPAVSQVPTDYEVISPADLLHFSHIRSPLMTEKKAARQFNRQRETVSDIRHFNRRPIEQAIEDYYVKDIGENVHSNYSRQGIEKTKRRVDSNQTIISDEEIRTNLLRLRDRRRQHTHQPSSSSSEYTVREIKEEIYDKLKDNNSSLLQRKRQDKIVPPLERENKISSLPNSFSSSLNSKNEPLSFQPIETSSSSGYKKKRHSLADNITAEQNSSSAIKETVSLLKSTSVERENPTTQQSLFKDNSPPLQSLNVQLLSGESYAYPPIDLLAPSDPGQAHSETQEKINSQGQLIEDKLAEFKVKVSVTDAYSGPVVTRYDIEPDTGVRGNQVVNLEKDLARALGCASIRIVDTIPGKTCMGLELPNAQRKMIRLSEILNSEAFLHSQSKLTLALGQDITGAPVVTDLTKSPHLLVAGTTGSGKPVGINAMILSMLYKATPDEVRLIMIDPKMLELSIYEDIPHLLAPVVTDMKLAPNALVWCVNEMEKRYKIMSQLGVRNIVGFNQKIKHAQEKGEFLANPFSLTPTSPEPLTHLPYIVVVIDEFADLMMSTGKKIEELIARLAQKARAAGIHLILATQRPSVDVITGLIKANIPSRIAFQVSSKIDSRTILDQVGAENLLGMGDMLFTKGSGYPLRVHGAFVADEEVHRVALYLKELGPPNYTDDILTAGVDEDDLFSNANGIKSGGEVDPMYDEAVNVVLTHQKASISFVQRNLRIGYNRAARLIEQMEADNIVSAPEGNGNRTILARAPTLD